MDVADFLGVSKGYISMVERGVSSLSRQNIKRIFDAEKEKQWDTSSFVPAYTRIVKIEEEVEDYHYSRGDGSGKEPRRYEIDTDVLSRIKEGVIGIPEKIARNYIQAYPELNFSYEWIMAGNGTMFEDSNADKITSMLSHISDQIAKIDKQYVFIIERLGRIEEAIDTIKVHKA